MKRVDLWKQQRPLLEDLTPHTWRAGEVNPRKL